MLCGGLCFGDKSADGADRQSGLPLTESSPSKRISPNGERPTRLVAATDRVTYDCGSINRPLSPALT
jgi:hypothetical protein